MAVLMGKGLDSEDKPKESDDEDDSAMSDDDADLSELGAKYMQRMGEAMEAKDWALAFKVSCRISELHSYMEKQERGY